jgi:hypothetical protein
MGNKDLWKAESLWLSKSENASAELGEHVYSQRDIVHFILVMNACQNTHRPSQSTNPGRVPVASGLPNDHLPEHWQRPRNTSPPCCLLERL